MMCKASVVVPVFNAEKTLLKCVESLLYGRERHIEVVLVDDCSNDNSWAICCKLEEQYQNVVAVQNKHNSGVSYTRNHGLQVASGKYILFMDSDDWGSGHFVQELLSAAEKNPRQLVMCGFHFLDNVHNNRIDYLWQNTSISEFVIKPEEYFSLVNHIMIQFVWNKVFRLDIIRQNGLHFDETQSMGEDFQFVLDYMKVAKPESCLVLNQALYYYVRANNTSLMSKMGLSGFEKSCNRLTQFAQLAGKTESQEYEKQILLLKQNYLYQIIHDRGTGKKEKIENIESVMQDGAAVQHYRKQCTALIKEKVYEAKNSVVSFKDRVVGKLQRVKRGRLIVSIKKQLCVKDFTIISQNCIGGVFYHDLGMKFLSPTINLFFEAADFVQFVLHLEDYLNKELELTWGETYPIGLLGDLRIHFMHYETCTEAKETWEKRKQRICKDRILVLASDRNGFDEDVYSEWGKISYPKVLFTAQKCFVSEEDTVYYAEYENDGFVPDLIPNREFYKNGVLVNIVNRYFRGGNDD